MEFKVKKKENLTKIIQARFTESNYNQIEKLSTLHKMPMSEIVRGIVVDELNFVFSEDNN